VPQGALTGTSAQVKGWLVDIDDVRPRPTMRDVAALAGVSLKTVSRVVNSEAGVSPELEGKVKAAALQLDYQPNLTASNLRRSDGRSRSIGLLLENVANPFSGALHRAIEEVARKRDVLVLAASLDEDEARERELARALVSRRVDGLIIMPVADDQSYLLTERRTGTPMVFVDRPPSHLDADTVLAGNSDGAQVAVEHLIEQGHRRIAYLGDDGWISTAVERHEGYVTALRQSGLTYDAAIVRHGLRTSESAFTALNEILTQPNPPTAVFASQNFVTIGACQSLHMLGLHHSVALVGFDEIATSDMVEPALTLVVQDIEGMGTKAAELLFSRIDGEDNVSQRCVFPTRLVVRGSGEIPGPYRVGLN